MSPSQGRRAQMAHAQSAAKVLASIAHPLRLLIICMVFAHERFVGEIVEELGTSKGNISQHLRLLELKGLIKKRRDGNRIFYSIKDPRISELVACVQGLYCKGLKL